MGRAGRRGAHAALRPREEMSKTGGPRHKKVVRYFIGERNDNLGVIGGGNVRDALHDSAPLRFGTIPSVQGEKETTEDTQNRKK